MPVKLIHAPKSSTRRASDSLPLKQWNTKRSRGRPLAASMGSSSSNALRQWMITGFTMPSSRQRTMRSSCPSSAAIWCALPGVA